MRTPVPLHIQRGSFIRSRLTNIHIILGSLPTGPLTRTEFRNRIEYVVGNAVSEWCDYLYAVANGKRLQAKRHWEMVQGIVEYELPLALLLPVKDLKGTKGREHAVKAVMPIIKAEMAGYRRSIEEKYTKLWKVLHRKNPLKGPLNRPDESRLQEVFPWINEVVWETLSEPHRCGCSATGLSVGS